MCTDCGDSNTLFYARKDNRYNYRIVILGKCKLCHLEKQNERQRSYWNRVRKFKKGQNENKRRNSKNDQDGNITRKMERGN
jgi:DNA-directed RNA polymerase subunit M/transcription elongation factor TFIIS